MSEVLELSTGSKGLFATKAYAKGEVILEESPLLIAAPSTSEESAALLAQLLGEETKASSIAQKSSGSNWSSIEAPSSVPEELHGTFRAMLRAGASWILRRRTTISEVNKTSLLELYHPIQERASEAERPVLNVASAAITSLKEKLFSQDFDDWDTLEKILLVWACNSFEGGRIYARTSRANHHCNPNTIVKATDDTQHLIAGTNIEKGDEITISYLGLLLYTETAVRKGKLRITKFFECGCSRCMDHEHDVAGQIPCPTRYPRETTQQSLEEDVQYDDDKTVVYVNRVGSATKEEKKLQVVMNNVTKKILAYLNTHGNGTSMRNEVMVDQAKRKVGRRDQEDEEEDTILEEHVGLASTIMGDKHWTTNLLRLLHLDRRLSLMSQAMLTLQELPEMEDVAEAIDSLQRIDAYVSSLGLKLDKGHILSDVIIGVARLLVSLGDEKSQKYAADWLLKIDDFVPIFESEGKQKVVSALSVAWKKHQRVGEGDDKEDENPPSKKQKAC